VMYSHAPAHLAALIQKLVQEHAAEGAEGAHQGDPESSPSSPHTAEPGNGCWVTCKSTERIRVFTTKFEVSCRLMHLWSAACSVRGYCICRCPSVGGACSAVSASPCALAIPLHCTEQQLGNDMRRLCCGTVVPSCASNLIALFWQQLHDMPEWYKELLPSAMTVLLLAWSGPQHDRHNLWWPAAEVWRGGGGGGGRCTCSRSCPHDSMPGMVDLPVQQLRLGCHGSTLHHRSWVHVLKQWSWGELVCSARLARHQEAGHLTPHAERSWRLQ
jgi:hypothetical protein